MNTSRQLNDLIKNVSGKTGINAQVLQKRYFMEQFLARVSESKYKDNFILKGGVLISALVGLQARSTMDIDITVKRLPLNAESVQNATQEIISTDLNDNVNFKFRKIENILEEAGYDCYRITLDVAFDKVRDSIRIDITAGDVITPNEIQFGYKTMLDNKNIALYSYNIETVMAEKIETILSRGVLNSRMRDFYDCFMLNKLYGNIIDLKIFYTAFKATVKKRKVEIVLSKCDTIISELKSSTELKKLWASYTNTFPYAKEISFEDLMQTLKTLLDKIGLL